MLANDLIRMGVMMDDPRFVLFPTPFSLWKKAKEFTDMNMLVADIKGFLSIRPNIPVILKMSNVKINAELAASLDAGLYFVSERMEPHLKLYHQEDAKYFITSANVDDYIFKLRRADAKSQSDRVKEIKLEAEHESQEIINNPFSESEAAGSTDLSQEE